MATKPRGGGGGLKALVARPPRKELFLAASLNYILNYVKQLIASLNHLDWSNPEMPDHVIGQFTSFHLHGMASYTYKQRKYFSSIFL